MHTSNTPIVNSCAAPARVPSTARVSPTHPQICIYIYIHTYMFVQSYEYIKHTYPQLRCSLARPQHRTRVPCPPANLCIYIYMYVYRHIHIHMKQHIHIYIKHSSSSARVPSRCTHISYIYTHTHTYIHTHIYVCIYIYVITYLHTNMCSHPRADLGVC